MKKIYCYKLHNLICNMKIRLALLFGTYEVEDIEPADYEDLANF